MESWTQIVLGWPSALGGAVFIFWGLASRKAWVSITGALPALGFCAYVRMNPAPFRWFGILAVIGNFLSAVAVRRGAIHLGAAAALPFFILVAYVASAVIRQ